MGLTNGDVFPKSQTHKKTKIENLVGQEMQRFYEKAKKILVENKKFLDSLALALIEKENNTINRY